MTTTFLSSSGPETASDEPRIRLAARVRQHGSLRFDQYMEQALYAPEYGYYESRHSVFGKSGDFVTAPGLGDLLSRCVARFCDVVLGRLGGGSIAEYGPGDGTLAQDVIGALRQSPDSYCLLERSSRLRDRQADILGGQGSLPRWVDRLPREFEGVALANEFVDVLPARCFEVTDEGILERMVTMRGNDFHWELQTSTELDAVMGKTFAELGQVPESGYCSEWRYDTCRDWLDELGGALHRGVVLILDYGYPRREYYHPQRSSGTLRCHTAHQAHSDPFRQPGHEDISIDVDFTTIAELATERGFDVLMFTSQTGFLLEYGLLEFAELSADADKWLAQRGQIEVLTHPECMGERFRVMALGRNFPGDLPHTVCPDHRNRL